MSKFSGRPIVAMVIAIVMVIVELVLDGDTAARSAQFPSIVPPEIQVTATYPGADAQTLGQSVAAPLEAQITGVDNMSFMYSVNANNGQSQITGGFRCRRQIEHRPGADATVCGPREHNPNCRPQVNTSGLSIRKSPTSPMMLVSLEFAQRYLRQCIHAYINLVDGQSRRCPAYADQRVRRGGSMRCGRG